MAFPKTLALLAVAAAICLSASVGVASAATPTSPAGTIYESKLHASSEGHVVIHNPIARIECASTLEGEAKAQGAGEPISVPLSSLTFTGCTNSWAPTVTSAGSLEIHSITGSSNGTISFTRFGITCRYKTENTDIGTLTASKTTGATATIDLSGGLPFHGGSGLCGSGATTFTGSYSVGTPDYLDIDATLGDIPTSPAGTIYEGKLHASSEGHVSIDNPIAVINCASTLEGEAKGQGAGEPVSVPLSSITFTGCTNSWAPTVTSAGSLEIHSITGSSNGTVTWSGATISFTRFGITCRYKTENTDIGTLTASKTTGATATIDLSGGLPFHSGSGLCGESATSLTGSLSVVTPDYLDVDAAL
jgi:hypothetical protein